MMLQPHPTANLMRNACTRLCRHTQSTLCATQQGKPHPDCAVGYHHVWWTRVLKVRGLVQGHRNSHWHSNREPHTCSWGQMVWPNLHSHPQGPSSRKCWDEIKGILRLKLWNANIHLYTSHFMELQQKDNETLAAYVHCFKTVAWRCTFHIDTVAICIFVDGLWDAHTTAATIYERTLILCLKSSE